MEILTGITEARIWTPPLRPLTPETSAGFEMCDWWRDKLLWEPMPWQEWATIHANELNEDGSHRFSEILILVSRQNGKSELLAYHILYWLAHRVGPILSSSASLDVSKEVWEFCCDIVEEFPDVYGNPKIIRVNGNWAIKLPDLDPKFARYKIISSSRRAGRGLTAKRVVMDELREMLDWAPHAAASNTTTAVRDSQIWYVSNAGDNRSIVLNHYRNMAMTGVRPGLCLLEWSAHEDAELSDRDAWRQANPAMGITITESALEGKLSQPASIFRTENLCSSVPSMDEVVSPAEWIACSDPGTLEAHRSKVVAFLDVSNDLAHSTLVVAALLADGRVRIETVDTWTNTAVLRKDLEFLLKKIKPKTFGYLAASPAASIVQSIPALKRKAKAMNEGESVNAVMGLCESIKAGLIAHSDDELLTSHILSAKRKAVGQGRWTFQRRDMGHLDGAMASAGAVWLARQVPEKKSMKLITSSGATDADIPSDE